jgi:hypothetical protein
MRIVAIGVALLHCCVASSTGGGNAPSFDANAAAQQLQSLLSGDAGATVRIPADGQRSIACRVEGACGAAAVEAAQAAVNKSSWWSCGSASGSAGSTGTKASNSTDQCFGKFAMDLQTNLDECTCAGDAQELPPHVAKLEAVVRLLGAMDITPEVTSKLTQRAASVLGGANSAPSDEPSSFDALMEVVANVAMQKARHCVFDVEAFNIFTRMQRIRTAASKCCDDNTGVAQQSATMSTSQQRSTNDMVSQSVQQSHVASSGATVQQQQTGQTATLRRL